MKTIVTDIPDYKTFLHGGRTLEIGYPWLTFGAIMALEKILYDSNGQFKILEIGMGGSTAFFITRCKKLISLEHDYTWFKRVEQTLGLIEGLCMSVPRLIGEIDTYLDKVFDLVLVDGGANWKERQQLLDASHSKVKKGGWLIIDNYERVKFDYTGWDVYTFDMFRYSGRGTKLCRKL